MAAWSSLVARLAHNQEVVGSNPTVRNQGTSPPIKVIQVVLYTDLLFQLPPMRSEQSVIGIQRSMWLAAKDHSKINEGEAKEKHMAGSYKGQYIALSRL